MKPSEVQEILITGATGYVGGRLVRRLEGSRHRIRCLARRPEYLKARVAPTTRIFSGDLLKPRTLAPAMEGVDTAYYLVHSMGSQGQFVEKEQEAAENFAGAARKAGVQRIIYLGALGSEEDLSSHLSSRKAVGRILRNSGVLTLEFQASIIIGSGSLSFEMIRALVTRLPVMVTPRWTRTLAQPIAIEDVLTYLTQALDLEISESTIFEIGGPDRISYLGLMQEYARLKHLRRLILPVPVLTPRLSSLWLGLVTPLFARVGAKLIDSVRNETVVQSSLARKTFDFQPLGVREAFQRALVNEDSRQVETRWPDSLSAQGSEPPRPKDRLQAGIVESRSVRLPCTRQEAFREILKVGGENGWYYARWLWRIRGWLDLLLGGVGLRRGRRDPLHLAPGDAVDCWRVESVESDRCLLLAAEMKMPGKAWLQFEVRDLEAEPGCELRLTAFFDPAGLPGKIYWVLLYPVHRLIFSGMLREMGKAIRSAHRARPAGSD